VGFPTFSGWDISVKTDQTVLNPVGVSLDGTMLANANIVAQCINGSGTGCGPSDGPGVVHVVVVSLGASASGDGLLFTIQYSAGTAGVSAVTIFNDSVFDPSGNSIAHNTIGGHYGGDFTIQASPSLIVAKTHPAKYTSTIFVTSTGGFAGQVCLAATSSPSTGITLSFATPCITVPLNGQATDKLTIGVALTAISNPGTYIITVTGTAIGAAHTTTITLNIPSSTSTGVGFPSITWTHHLSVSATGGTQTWTATVSNALTTGQYVQITVNGISSIGTHPFTAKSAVVFVPAATTTTITFSSASGEFTAADIGMTFNFTAGCTFGSTAGSLNNVSNSQSGSFTVTA
jgi:hypothetical protein